MIPNRSNELDDILLHRRRYKNLPKSNLGCEEVVGSSYGSQAVQRVLELLSIKNLDFLFEIRIPQMDPKQKAIEMGFGEAKGTLIFDRILCCKHHEGIRELVADAVHSDLSLTHRFEQGGLRFRRSSVDLIGQDNLS